METNVLTKNYNAFIAKLSFKDAIKFFDFMISDMLQDENHAMYDINTKQGMAELLNSEISATIDIKAIYGEIVENYPKQVVVIWAIDKGFTICTPQEALMTIYKDWFLDHLNALKKEEKNRYYIDTNYPNLLDSLFVDEVNEKNKKHITCECCKRPFKRPNLPFYNLSMYGLGVVCMDCAEKIEERYNEKGGFAIGRNAKRYINSAKDNEITPKIAYMGNYISPFVLSFTSKLNTTNHTYLRTLDEVKTLRDVLNKFIDECEV